MAYKVHPWLKAFNDADSEFNSIDSDAMIDIIEKWESVSQNARTLSLKLHNILDLDLLAECKALYGDGLKETVFHLAELLTDDAVAIDDGWVDEYTKVSRLTIRIARLLNLKKLNAPDVIINTEAKLVAQAEVDDYMWCGPAERKNLQKSLAVLLF